MSREKYDRDVLRKGLIDEISQCESMISTYEEAGVIDSPAAKRSIERLRIVQERFDKVIAEHGYDLSALEEDVLRWVGKNPEGCIDDAIDEFPSQTVAILRTAADVLAYKGLIARTS